MVESNIDSNEMENAKSQNSSRKRKIDWQELGNEDHIEKSRSYRTEIKRTKKESWENLITKIADNPWGIVNRKKAADDELHNRRRIRLGGHNTGGSNASRQDENEIGGTKENTRAKREL